MSKRSIILLSTLGVLIVAAVLTRVLFFTFVDNYEYAYEFNLSTGKCKALVNEDGVPKHGYVTKVPFYRMVHTIDMRPMQVCINANSRVLNCKLVEFDPSGLQTFIAWHGRGDYSGSRLEDIMKSYAYDPSSKSYPFMKIVKELKNESIDYTIYENDTTDVTEVKDTIQ